MRQPEQMMRGWGWTRERAEMFCWLVFLCSLEPDLAYSSCSAQTPAHEKSYGFLQDVRTDSSSALLCVTWWSSSSSARPSLTVDRSLSGTLLMTFNDPEVEHLTWDQFPDSCCEDQMEPKHNLLLFQSLLYFMFVCFVEGAELVPTVFCCKQLSTNRRTRFSFDPRN